jgi:protein TonB
VLAAGIISLLLHLVLASSFTGRSVGGPRGGDTPAQFLTARLIRDASPFPAPAVPQVSEDAAPPQQVWEIPVQSQFSPDVSAESASAESAAAAGAPLTDAPDLTYYAARQLDIYPALASVLDLRYPEHASAARVTGRAAIVLLIDHTGTVNDVTVIEADPPGYFEEDVRRAFMAARFRPALKGGRAVRSRVIVNIDYSAEHTNPEPTPH